MGCGSNLVISFIMLICAAGGGALSWFVLTYLGGAAAGFLIILIPMTAGALALSCISLCGVDVFSRTMADSDLERQPLKV